MHRSFLLLSMIGSDEQEEEEIFLIVDDAIFVNTKSTFCYSISCDPFESVFQLVKTIKFLLSFCSCNFFIIFASLYRFVECREIWCTHLVGHKTKCVQSRWKVANEKGAHRVCHFGQNLYAYRVKINGTKAISLFILCHLNGNQFIIGEQVSVLRAQLFNDDAEEEVEEITSTIRNCNRKKKIDGKICKNKNVQIVDWNERVKNRWTQCNARKMQCRRIANRTATRFNWKIYTKSTFRRCETRAFVNRSSHRNRMTRSETKEKKRNKIVWCNKPKKIYNETTTISNRQPRHK